MPKLLKKNKCILFRYYTDFPYVIIIVKVLYTTLEIKKN